MRSIQFAERPAGPKRYVVPGGCGEDPNREIGMEINSKDKVVFLGRDGVINENTAGGVKHWNEFFFIFRSLRALRLLHENGYRVMVVTNQPAVSQGIITMDALMGMHARMKAAVDKAGGHIFDIFVCPHQEEDGCDCRKPNPGLIYQAKEEYGIKIPSAIVVGDSTEDVLAGKNAGIVESVLIKGRSGTADEEALKNKGAAPDYVATDLFDAVSWILEK